MKIEAVARFPSECKQFIAFASKGEAVSLPGERLNEAVREALAHGLFRGETDEIVPLSTGELVAVLVGLGDADKKPNARKLGERIKMALNTRPLSTKRPVALIPPNDAPETIRALVDGALLGTYRWDRYIAKKEDAEDPRDFHLFINTAHGHLTEHMRRICEGVNLARDLGNENADVADPLYLEAKVRELTEHDVRCCLKVLDEKEMVEKGLGLHLAVSQGSGKPPRLLIVSYKGRATSDPFTALIGKGITFDSGGLNLKRSEIEIMRMDMCGAAAVIGALHNAIHLDIPGNAYFVCALAENAIGPGAYKPGDVIRSYCGKSVEVGNTDAEGRLVLADANSYIARNHQPEAIINIATLTGACLVALGLDHAGLMSTHDDLAEALLQAARVTDDRAWRMPIYEELREHVKSEIADIKNLGLPRLAGTMAAGEFLRQFAQCDDENLPWAHLDIAGTAMLDRALGCFEPGASGAGVRLLTQYLVDRAAAERIRTHE